MVIEILNVALMPSGLVCWLGLSKDLLSGGLGWAGLRHGGDWTYLGWDDIGRESVEWWWMKVIFRLHFL